MTQPSPDNPAASGISLREFMPTAVRAWTIRGPTNNPDARRRTRPKIRRAYRTIRDAIVLDTETSTDPSQHLLYGAFRHERLDPLSDGSVQVTPVTEGLIHADDLPHTNPDGYARLVAYAAARKADVDLSYPGVEPNWSIELVSRTEFVKRWVHRVGYRRRKGREPALLVMFNAPFDLSRLAVDVAEARGDMYGGFSFTLWTDGWGKEAPYRPRLVIKAIDSKRALKKFRRVERGAHDFAGHILDLRTLVFALTGASHSLQSACEAFGVTGKSAAPEFGTITDEAIDYCRQDVRATSDLLEAVLGEYFAHPIDLAATQAYSPASIAKAYLRGMGIVPRLAAQPDFPAEVLGAAMSAFFGGRADVHIRQTKLPIALVDVTSMYPTVDILMDLWRYVIAQRVDIADATHEVRDLLDAITPEDCYGPACWPEFVGLAQVMPDGDVLPVRAIYEPLRDDARTKPAWSIGLNQLHDEHRRWYAIPDLVAAKILTGRTPRIARAIRFLPGKPQRTVTPIALRGQQTIDPTREDFFRHVVETRQRLKMATADHDAGCGCAECRTHRFLKVLANAGSYGIYAEMRRHELSAGAREKVTVHGPDDEPFVRRVSAPEDPGEYCFPPIAACITAAARLVLALIEHEVTARGGSWMFCDTDSFAIVATATGGLPPCRGGDHTLRDGAPAVRALSYAEVEEIRTRINQLNPYDRDLVPDLLKLEQTGECYAISAKRYVITDPTGRIVKRSQHGLGRLLDPVSQDETRRDGDGNPHWIDECWGWILDAADNPAPTMPAWVDLPAMSRITISSTVLHRPFARWNRFRGWRERIKPFNFVLVPTIDGFGFPPGTDPTRFRLIGPYRRDPATWAQLAWRNLYDPSGPTYRITTDRNAPADPDLVIVKSYRDILTEYRVHPEHKYDAPDGGPCRRDTAGVLRRRAVRAYDEPRLVGKEANKLDDVQAGIVASIDEVATEYHGDTGWRPHLVLPVLVRYSGRELAQLTGVDRRTIDRIRRGAVPRETQAARLTRLAVVTAIKDLRTAGVVARSSADAAVLAAWRALRLP